MGTEMSAQGQRYAELLDSLLGTLLESSGLDLAYTFGVRSAESIPLLTVELSGTDVPALLARNAELLLAFEHLGAKALRLEDEQHDRISFDAGGFKAARERRVQREAAKAVQQVHATRQPYRFPPMNSRERRLLHLALAPSGLKTASEGEGPARRLVVYPA